jgi:hypothetical protein
MSGVRVDFEGNTGTSWQGYVVDLSISVACGPLLSSQENPGCDQWTEHYCCEQYGKGFSGPIPLISHHFQAQDRQCQWL